MFLLSQPGRHTLAALFLAVTVSMAAISGCSFSYSSSKQEPTLEMMLSDSPQKTDEANTKTEKDSSEAEQASSVETFRTIIRYHIYAGGFHAMTVTAGFAVEPDGTYRADAHLIPHGWVGALLPWQGRLLAYGQVIDDKLQPMHYTKYDHWGDELTRTVINFNEQGDVTEARRIASENDTVTSDYEHNVDKSKASGTVDLMTGLFELMRNKERDNDLCQRAIPVFDGKRKYQITLSKADPVNLDENKYSNFSGEATKCTFEIIPVWGFENAQGFYRLQEDSRERGKLPQIWLSDLLKREENSTRLPVRFEFYSKIGTAISHFQEIVSPTEEQYDLIFDQIVK